ncbi:MAG: amidohydrolase [Gemmatimonadales bacterium]|nr:amidohydrolase [Gemmatimonadales bacterium]
MRFFRLLYSALLVLAIVGCNSSETDGDAKLATLVLTGGTILTLNTREPNPAPTTVAIAGNRILYVGDEEGARSFVGSETVVEDLQGAVIIPGFCDSHGHLYGLGKALAEIDLVGTPSAAKAVDLVRAEAEARPELEWLQGRGWDQNDWDGQKYPGRELLDAAVPDRPVMLRRIDGHAAWVNSEALRLAGIGKDTPDPEGGAILRDKSGAPTGILVDNAADLVRKIIPEVSDKETRRRVHLAVEHCLEYGITGVHEAGVTWQRAQLYRRMVDQSELHLRLYGMYDDLAETLEHGLAAGPVSTPDGMLTIRAVKLYADGALGSRGALLLAGYSDQPGNFGLAVTPRDHLVEVAQRAGKAGFQVCTHAIGDGGNRLMLDVYEQVLGELNPTDPRWRIEHAQILDPNDLPRFAKLGVIAAMQPTHCTSDMDWAGQRLGPDRLSGAYAWRTLLDSGARLSFGTDFPIEHVDPLAGLYSARTRTHPDGTPTGGWQPQEILDGRTALELYTAGGAYTSFRENELGRVAPGFLADLTVLDGDPVACPPKELLDMKVKMTIVGGKVAYRAN